MTLDVWRCWPYQGWRRGCFRLGWRRPCPARDSSHDEASLWPQAPSVEVELLKLYFCVCMVFNTTLEDFERLMMLHMFVEVNAMGVVWRRRMTWSWGIWGLPWVQEPLESPLMLHGCHSLTEGITTEATCHGSFAHILTFVVCAFERPGELAQPICFLPSHLDHKGAKARVNLVLPGVFRRLD